ncbi:MAG: NAD(P)H-dependent oxidoreductase [Bacteroidales bacterium]|nr:NAD(P)H-dependent oxidoreductase [Bacteroidales bacterium]
MKRFFIFLYSLTVIIFSSCSQNKAETGDLQSNNHKKETAMKNEEIKTLVVFFSHAGENYSVGNIEVGNTKIVADYISKRTGAAQFEIVCEKDYDMPYMQLIELAKKEAKDGELPAFKGKIDNIEQYDTIFIGGPVWWGTYPQVMFTFFKEYDLSGKVIIPFTTHEGSGLASCVDDVEKAYPKAEVKEGFSLYGHEVRQAESKVNKWLEALGF